MNAKLLSAALIITLSTVVPGQEPSTVRLNLAAVENARRLLAEGRVINDTKGHWRIDRPSTRQENDFLREKGFSEYAKWFLAVDLQHPPNTKAHYKFPFGDFRNVHRCGLVAVKSRAREFRYANIEAAAEKLLNDERLRLPMH